MESTSRSVQIQVGIFLGIGLIAILVSIFMIGGDKSLFTGRMRLHGQFEQVQGLAEGSVVSLSGINVGNIERIDFIPEANKVDVVMLIDKRFSPRITEGSQVEIRTAGALGDKFIFIIAGDAKGALLEDGAVLPVAAATDFLGIISERGKETEKIFGIIDELYKTTKTINADGRLNKMMENMAAASGSLKEASKEAQTFTAGLTGSNPAKLKSTVDRLDSILAKVDRGEGTLGALINDPTLHERLKTMLGGSSRPQHIKSMLRTSIEKAESK